MNGYSRWLFPAALAATLGCQVNEGRRVALDGRTVLLTILHTSDIHSRLLPYDLQVGEVDRRLGLLQENSPFGGAARLAYLVRRERARSGRSLYIDTGDPFQGAPIFNFFGGEVEFRILSELGVDAMVVGNHEFDLGAANLSDQLDRWAGFQALAANYRFVPSTHSNNALARLVRPFVTRNVDGLRVTIVGVGDTTSMHSIYEPGNRLGITPTHVARTVQWWIDFLRPSSDVVLVATHQGLRQDEEMIRCTTGIDVVLGGHLHVVLDPPKAIPDCAACGDPGIREELERRGCASRSVVLAHSGAFLKYLGRLDLVLRQAGDPIDGFEVVTRDYAAIPIDATVPEDPVVAYLLEPYAREMERTIDLDRLIGYAPSIVRRFGAEGGDSQLGNLVADSMWMRRGIETDFAMTNTTGLRANIDAGPVTIETLFNVFPFDNTITTMFLSGPEVVDLFDYIARRTASRGCTSQAQIAGARVALNCRGAARCLSCRHDCGGTPCLEPCIDGRCGRPCDREACVESIDFGTAGDPRPIDMSGSYELATSNYLAQGGSGYSMLRRNTTQRDSGIPQRDAAIDRIRSGRPCTVERPCSADADCPPGQTCACPGRWRWSDSAVRCDDDGPCAGPGWCVLPSCVAGVADLYARKAITGAADDPEQIACGFRGLAGAECAAVACVDERIGAAEDGRIRAYLP